jgi:hypothetical protein
MTTSPYPAPAATPELAQQTFAFTREARRDRVDALLAEPLESLGAAALVAVASRIRDDRLLPSC